MAIHINLDEQMKKKGYTLVQLADKVGISTVNLSRLKNGNVTAIRFSTLDAICKVLECEPGDLIKYKQLSNKVIPLYLDYSGTTDLLLSGGAKNVKKFFDAIINLQSKTNSEVQITMVTGSAFESAKSKFTLLNELASNYGLPNLFDGAVAEYCGFLIKNDKSVKLLELDTRILEKRPEISALAESFGGAVSPKVTSFYNVVFDVITREDLARFSEAAEQLINSGDIETITYFDEYGKECDIKPKKHTKSEAVYMLLNKLSENHEIPFAIIGGDSQEEDLRMYTQNKDRIKSNLGLETVFIAPSNIGEISQSDRNIIIGDWENSDGIATAIETLTSRINIKDDGGIEL